MKVIQLKYLGVPWLSFNLERLIRHMVQFNWQQECEIVTDYIPEYADKHHRPECVIRWKNPRPGNGNMEYRYLRYSHGPAQGYFWDISGDDFMYPELALIALQKCPAPTTWELR